MKRDRERANAMTPGLSNDVAHALTPLVNTSEAANVCIADDGESDRENGT